ncbi:MAG: tetratricopeptide repeat protein [Myxococcaceae bacterium]
MPVSKLGKLLLTATFAVSTISSVALAEGDKKAAKEVELKKKETSLAPDKSLAGDVTRKKEKRDDAPTLKYDQFRLGVEMQVAEKRREQIRDLQQIIKLNQDKKETPSLLFRLGELYWEESKYYFFEANRKDDDKIKALNADDKAGVEAAEAEKNKILEQSKAYAGKAVEAYSRIVQEFKDFERTDEVLYFLGLNLMEMGDEKRGLVAYNRLISKYQKSKYIPDSYLAVGEYWFNGSKGKRESLEKALENYKNASKFPENQVYGYALYKQGWCYFNMSDYEKAMDQFKSVVLYAKFAGTEEVEGKKGAKGSRAGLAKEARTDYVRAFARGNGTPGEAKDRFNKLADTPDELRIMMKQLANLFYEDGKDKEAALAFDMLIKERPISPEAPGFQSKIVDCVMRAGNKQMTVQQVRRLVKIMDDVVKGNPKMEDKDQKAMDEARELSERTISRLAVEWHNEGKKTRDEQTFEFANAVYADYLTLFPKNPKAYDLRFFWAELLNDNLNKYDRAAAEYTTVFAQDIERLKKNEKMGKWGTNASYNAILAWTEVVKKLEADGTIKPEASADPQKKLTIPPAKQSLLEACENYLKYIEKGEKKVEIAYKAARIYYDYNHLDEAVARLSDIALKYPDYKFEDGSKAGEVAANLVLDSYNLIGDWAKVNEWARKFYAEDKLAQGQFRVELAKLIEQSSFKLINQLEAKKDYAKAAEAYMTFVNEWPKSDYADKALHNAAIDFFNARMLNKAIEVRKQLIQKHPKSSYVPQDVFALAEGYEAIADFDPAADYYELYATNYEKNNKGGAKKGKAPPPAKKGAADKKPEAEQVWEEQKAQDALFNAGVFREGLSAYKQALKNREKYLELWPTSKDAETIEKSILDLYEKMGQWGKVTKGLEEYEKKYSKDPNKILTAEGRIANIYEEKQKNAKAARGVYSRITDYYEKLGKKQREALEITALDAVARASFIENEDDWKKYSAMKLRWSKVQNIGELKASILSKSNALQDIQKAYTKTVAYKSADPAICALHKIGMAYDQLAEGLVNFPIPKGLPEEILIELRPQFEQQAEPVKKNAAEAFTAVVQKSQELDVFNACTVSALEMLRNKYRPEAFPKMREDVMELKQSGDKQLVIGGDVLTSIQAVPTITPEQQQAIKNNAAEVGSRPVADTMPEVDLSTPSNDSPPPTKKDTTTAKAPTPEPKKNTPAPAPAPTPAPKGKDDEPEDTL